MMSLFGWALIAVGGLLAFVCSPGPTYDKDGQQVLSQLHRKEERVSLRNRQRLMPLGYLAIGIGAILLLLCRLDELLVRGLG